MPELTPKERLLPSLLDRLTDDSPEKKKESREYRAMSMSQFREAVKRDLEWLMNTVNQEAVTDFENFPELRSTVINYGVPGLAGQTTNDRELASIKALIQHAIESFEPRIISESLKVALVEDYNKPGSHSIAYEIQGMLWGRPLPEALFLRTELDLEIGSVTVTDA